MVHIVLQVQGVVSGSMTNIIERQVPRNTGTSPAPFANRDIPFTPFPRTSLARSRVAPQSFPPQPAMPPVVEFTAEKCHACQTTWDGCTPEQREQWAGFTSAATGRPCLPHLCSTLREEI